MHLTTQRPNSEALFFWKQAQEFFDASVNLSPNASPLTSYYCILNAAKSLLTVLGEDHGGYHGLSGSYSRKNAKLRNEEVKLKSGGVFPALAKVYGYTVKRGTTYNLHDLLYVVPFVHRAFRLTHPTSDELLLPLEKPRFVKKMDGTETWFCADIPPSYREKGILGRFPAGYEVDTSSGEPAVVRRCSRFSWKDSTKDELARTLMRLGNYHNALRQDVIPIVTDMNRWYLRLVPRKGGTIDLPYLTILFATMHRLSELARYDPLRLSRHLGTKHSWLLTEFLDVAPAQFVHLVASEITGREFIRPDAVRLGSA